MRGTLGAGDAFLLGTDLVKDPARLVAAYDDAQGVTAEFNKNVLAVLDRELGADFDPDAFEHVAVWDAEHEWIEMRLESTRDQRVHVGALDLEVEFAAGEQMRTEISAKFRRDGVDRRARGGRAARSRTGGPTRPATSRCRCPCRPTVYRSVVERLDDVLIDRVLGPGEPLLRRHVPPDQQDQSVPIVRNGA